MARLHPRERRRHRFKTNLAEDVNRAYNQRDMINDLCITKDFWKSKFA